MLLTTTASNRTIRSGLLALQSNGETVVECVVYDVDDLQAELMEIDENLARSELSPAEEAAHILRRKEIWEDISGVETGARNSRTSLSDGRKSGPQHERKFASEVAAVVGAGRKPEAAKRDAQLEIARARDLGQDIHRIIGTSLDKGVEMDALLKLPKPERAELIERAAAGEQVSARPPKEKAKTALEAMAVIEAPTQDRKAMQRQRFWDMWASLDDDVRQELTAVLVAKAA